MAVGHQATSVELDNTLTSCATGMRNICQQIAWMQQQVVAMGIAGLVKAGYSNTPDAANPGGVSDAQLAMNMWSYLSTNSGVFFGTATQGALFNFSGALAGTYSGT